MSDKTTNQDNDYKYLYEKVGECASGIHFLKWMLGLFVVVFISLFSLSFSINSKVSKLTAYIGSDVLDNNRRRVTTGTEIKQETKRKIDHIGKIKPEEESREVSSIKTKKIGDIK